MKFILRVLLFISIACIAFGYYTNEPGNDKGEKWIGIGVLVLAFLLMPLFIYHRYKDKDLSSYSFKDFTKKPKDDQKD